MAAGGIGGQTLGGGSFYGAVQRRLERHGAIFTDLQHSAARKLPAHSHELSFFGLLLDGQYGESYLRRQKQYGSFTIMYRPAGIPHQDEIGPRGVNFFEIEIRPIWCKRFSECGISLDTACEDCGGGELLWLGMKLFRELHGPTPADDLCVESLLAELLNGVAGRPRERIREAPDWLRRIVQKLRAEFCSRLTLDELGREAGVHPVHLSRVFRKCVGEGIGDYVQRLRIQRACEQMLSPRTGLADISFELGFADQSHFARTFRKITGMTPSAFRAMLGPRYRPA